MISNLFEARYEDLFFYSPYNFIRNIKRDFQTDVYISSLSSMNNKDHWKEIEVDGENHVFVTEYLSWDSNYFNTPTYKLNTVLFDHTSISTLSKAVSLFLDYFKGQRFYSFIEIPSEDVLLLQALCLGGYKLIETRLTYFNDKLNNYDYPRFGVREANLEDLNNLKRVAKEMRNDYDRFHADDFFSDSIADDFLSIYIEESIKGFVDVVLTPNVKSLPSDSFLTANFLKKDWGVFNYPMSKMVLSAVSESNRGWYVKLISEMTYLLKDQGAKCVFMNTQSTNRAVYKTWGKLGYNLGGSVHVLSASNKK